MDGFSAELWRRLPLGQAALRVSAYALDSQTLEGVFEAHRGRCYQDLLTFERLIQLILRALTVHGGSGHRAFVAAASEGLLPVAEQNIYGKLARIPVEMSMGLLCVGAARLWDLLPAGQEAVPLPSCVSDWKVIAFDGKKIKHAAKRLKPLRGQPGKLLGGKLLVALDVRCSWAMAMNADLDGERNDVPLVPGLVHQVRERVRGPILWMGDRQFGNLDVPALLTARPGDHFLLRVPKSLRLFADPQRPPESRKDEPGRTVMQEWGWIGAEDEPRRRYVRRITLQRPGEEAILLITDLLEAQAYPATDLLAVYLQRWGIERVFQEVTEVFQLQTLIGSTPQAMIFQSALCFLLYDMIQVVRSYVAEDGRRRVAEVSSEKLFWDVREQLTTWKNLGKPEIAVQTLAWDQNDRTHPPIVMQHWLRTTLTGCWRDHYRKAPPRKRTPPIDTPRPPATVPPGHGGHTSTWRLLQAARKKSEAG